MEIKSIASTAVYTLCIFGSTAMMTEASATDITSALQTECSKFNQLSVDFSRQLPPGQLPPGWRATEETKIKLKLRSSQPVGKKFHCTYSVYYGKIGMEAGHNILNSNNSGGNPHDTTDMSCPRGITLQGVQVKRYLPRGWQAANSLLIEGNLFKETRENGLTECQYKSSGASTQQLTMSKIITPSRSLTPNQQPQMPSQQQQLPPLNL
ncbi:MAG: hypothetical protein ABW166_15450 [Sedimenticola sp.]